MFTSLHYTRRWSASGANNLKIEIIPAELKQEAFLRGISMLTLQEVLRSRVNQIR